MNAKHSVCLSSGFSGAAGFSLLELWVQEGTTQSALTKACFFFKAAE